MKEEDNFNKKKSNILLWIIGIIVVIFILAFIFFKGNNIAKNNENNSNYNVENNTSNNIFTNSSNSIDNINMTNTTTYSNEIPSSESEEKDINGDFLMAIEDVFSITGRGTVVTGRIERGTIKPNDTVQIIGLKDEIITTTVVGIEMFRKNEEIGEAGDNVGLNLKDISKTEVERGQVVAKPNSISNKTKFTANIKMYTIEEGGRHTPFFNGYKPQFYIRTTDITGVIALEAGIEMVKPGETISANVELSTPIALEIGTKFKIREAGKTVGEGTVTALY